MKADRVFVAFLKSDNEEHLLYKKEDNLYYDLNTKEKYHSNDIDFNTLIFLKDSIYFLEDNISKRNAKKIYNDDRKMLLDISKFYVVNIKQVQNLEKKDYEINNVRIYRWLSNDLYKIILKRNCAGSYSDLRINKVYIEPNQYTIHNGELYIDEKNPNDIIPLSELLKYYGMLEKKKVLNLSYKLSKKENIK